MTANYRPRCTTHGDLTRAHIIRTVGGGKPPRKSARRARRRASPVQRVGAGLMRQPRGPHFGSAPPTALRELEMTTGENFFDSLLNTPSSPSSSPTPEIRTLSSDTAEIEKELQKEFEKDIKKKSAASGWTPFWIYVAAFATLVFCQELCGASKPLAVDQIVAL